MNCTVIKDGPPEIVVLSVSSGEKTNISLSIATLHVEHLCHPLELRKPFN